MNDRQKRGKNPACGTVIVACTCQWHSESSAAAALGLQLRTACLMHAGIVHIILNLLVDQLQAVPRSRLPELLGMVVRNLQMVLKAIFRTGRDPNVVPLLQLDPEV
jgi:hypothetical protein